MSGLLRRASAATGAGAVGTLAMDLLWYERYRAGGGEDGFTEWEFSAGTTSFEEASAPAKFARRVASAVGIELPDRSAATVTNAMHWLTGVGYAVVVQTLVGRKRNVAASALATGGGAFLNSYAVLGTMGLYQPIWEYDRETLTEDLSAHLLFGATTALTYRLLTMDLLSPRRRRPAGGR